MRDLDEFSFFARLLFVAAVGFVFVEMCMGLLPPYGFPYITVKILHFVFTLNASCKCICACCIKYVFDNSEIFNSVYLRVLWNKLQQNTKQERFIFAN